ncbi:MAG: PHP domain-containing protein [Candidatus Marsarchaeota archaeon]|nr:PHP domain-containing protein [Candidatus Marsarchaeota archaeon]
MALTRKFDLHCHSIFSPDSITPVEKLVERYASLGFAGFALTDHGNMNGAAKAKAHISKKKLALEFIPACEFVTERGDLIGLYLEEMISSREPLELIDSIHSQGGLAILPHPFDSLRGRSAMNPDKLGKDGWKRLDGMEVLNARAAKGANEKALSFAASHSLARAGGSDAHFLFEAGKAYTQVPEGMELDRAIRKKATSAGGSTSPIFVHGPTKAITFGKKLGLLPRS